MVVANMATFPPRAEKLPQVVDRILPQVDRLNIVFNEYDAIPPQYRNRPGLTPILPSEDTKDVGKFYPDVSDADYVFLVDDDVKYPHDYISAMVCKFEALPTGRFLAGLHTSIYRKPRVGLTVGKMRRYAAFFLVPRRIAAFREVTSFNQDLGAPMLVDQVATNAAILRGRDMPSYAYMRDSHKFVDVRLARWCFEQGIKSVALPRKSGWLETEADEHSIFWNFTQKHPAHVADEIRTYAFKRKFVGQSVAAPARRPQDNPAKG